MFSNENLTMADGYFNKRMQLDFQNIVLGGPTIPSIALVCDNCGFISEHAIEVLGLL